MKTLFGAIDIGASSGRVIAGFFEGGKLSLNEVHRFPNGPETIAGELRWNFEHLFSEVITGLHALSSFAEKAGSNVVSIGIDTWAVDYGLLRDGKLLEQPYCYRDPNNEKGVGSVHQLITGEELYRINGLQHLPFNTIFQFAKHSKLAKASWGKADKVLLIPDLIGFLLTGVAVTEKTNASTTGLLDCSSRQWSKKIATELDINLDRFPKLLNAGESVGKLIADFGPRLRETSVVLVGSHDTASAVVGVPSVEPNFAFISSGTWSLLGAEISEPVLTDESREANFTNELGVDNRVRFLKNLSGLWLLSESLRYWSEAGKPQDLVGLLEDARLIEPADLLDVSDADFIVPGGMPEKIIRQLERAGKETPKTPAEFTALILHSLCASYAKALVELEKVTGRVFDKIFVTGGGSQNALLNELTARYCQRQVVAGPVEATAIGNLLVQVRAAGLAGPSLEVLRSIILNSDFSITTYGKEG